MSTDYPNIEYQIFKTPLARLTKLIPKTAVLAIRLSYIAGTKLDATKPAKQNMVKAVNDSKVILTTGPMICSPVLLFIISIKNIEC